MQTKNIKNVKIGTECVDKELLEQLDLLQALLDKRDLETAQRLSDELGCEHYKGTKPFPEKTYLFYRGWSSLRKVTDLVYHYLFFIKHMKRDKTSEDNQLSKIDFLMKYIPEHECKATLTSRKSFPDKFKVYKPKR